MPRFNSIEKLEKIYMPSTEGLEGDEKAWVVIDTSPPKAGDLYNVQGTSNSQAMFDVVLGRIREWNYIDGQGELFPINIDSLKLMEIDDFKYIQKVLDELETPESMTADQKKTSSDTSSQAVNVPVVSQ